ncbi:COG4705 family protein [Mycobacterium antarcticum]|uniref:COG4705 family protein n=1 Tax=Mycolicibacterium sp. TUM20984 TaxID=3023368 RepID=UPI0023A12A71|nr:hypothetical protein [Mycolicibacterium sp. TUM20984]GLP81023.1 membrane protein [Mycolicibacterium sp. TUM20984]
MPLLTTGVTRSSVRRELVASKVPEITALFWVLKLFTTAMGENASDYLVHTNPYIGLAIGVVGFIVTLGLQLRTRRYHPVVYWAAVSMVAVLGTMVADVLHGGLGVPLPVSTVACACVLAVTFMAWYHTERTLSIHSITTRRREVFYWLAVSFTLVLGTAAGDLTADTLGLGFLGSIALFTVIMAIPVVGRFGFGLNSVLAFWFAYIVSRPLGASFADWLGKPARAGGVGLGDGPVAGVLALAIATLVTCIALRRRNTRMSSTKGSNK